MDDPRRAEVEALVAKWQDPLQLTTWDIDVAISGELHTEDAEIKATTTTLYRYYRALITIYPPFWTRSAIEQERIIIHELYHPLLEELADLVNQEFVTKKNLEDCEEKAAELLSRGAWAIANTRRLWRE